MSRRRPALPPVQRGAMDPNQPESGRWLIRMGKDCPPMPASIKQVWPDPADNPGLYHPTIIANIGWQDADPLKVWTARRIKTLTEAEYRFEMARVTWVKYYAPDEPEAQPDKPVDLGTIKPIGPKE